MAESYAAWPPAAMTGKTPKQGTVSGWTADRGLVQTLRAVTPIEDGAHAVFTGATEESGEPGTLETRDGIVTAITAGAGGGGGLRYGAHMVPIPATISPVGPINMDVTGAKDWTLLGVNVASDGQVTGTCSGSVSFDTGAGGNLPDGTDYTPSGTIAVGERFSATITSDDGNATYVLFTFVYEDAP